MDELDPVQQLQHLLDDRGKLLEKISSIRSAFGSIRPHETTASAESAAPTPHAEEIKTLQEASTPRYGRTLETLRAIQTQLQERVLPLAHASARAQIEQLQEQAAQAHAEMNHFLEQVDGRMLDCLKQIRESQRKYTELTVLNQKLASLGAPTEPLPDSLPAELSVIESRLDALRRQGKI